MEWRDVDGFPGYKVSDTGLVLGIRGKPLKPQNNRGYSKVTLHSQTGRFDKSIHRLVLLSFKPIVDHGIKQVNHIDGNKSNNNLGSLEWTTLVENKKHAACHNLVAYGENNFKAKLKEDDVHAIACLLLNTDLTYQQLAEQFIVGTSNICSINQGGSWKRVTSHYTKNYPIRCRQ